MSVLSSLPLKRLVHLHSLPKLGLSNQAPVGDVLAVVQILLVEFADFSGDIALHRWNTDELWDERRLYLRPSVFHPSLDQLALGLSSRFALRKTRERVTHNANF